MKRLKINFFSFLLLFLSVAVLSGRSASQAPDPLKAKTDSLYETVKRFQDAWYKEKNQEKFWNFVALNARIRELKPAGSSFFVAFERREPDRAKAETLKIEGINKKNLELIRKNNLKPLPLNLSTADELVILLGDDEFLKGAFKLSDRELAEAKEGGFFPKGEFFLVLYGVSGEGYYKHGFVSFWVQEGQEWKLFHFIQIHDLT